ncbi:hypothetical protein [Escherichia coli]|uniref:hypothetical protein n=1 Tax=Escherichia coli TaxID=562 RepID=UPI003D6ABB70
MIFLKNKASHKTACLIAQYGDSYLHIANLYLRKHMRDKIMETSARNKMQNVPEQGVIHEQVRVLLTIENGKVIYSKHLLDNEFVGCMDTFLWMAKRAGYTIIPPAKEQTL